jgi:hypothetical protein
MSERGDRDLGGTAGFGGSPRLQQDDAGTASVGGTGGRGGFASGGGASAAVDQAKDTAQQLASQAKEQVTQKAQSGLHRGKTMAAESLGGVAQSLLQSSQHLRDQNQGAGQYVEQAAQRLQGLSDFLQNTEVDEIIDRVESTARRQPALFLGGAFMLGLLGARFLKSSRRQQSGQRFAGDHAGAYGGAYQGAYGGASAGGASASRYGTYPDADVGIPNVGRADTYGASTPLGSTPGAQDRPQERSPGVGGLDPAGTDIP